MTLHINKYMTPLHVETDVSKKTMINSNIFKNNLTFTDL